MLVSYIRHKNSVSNKAGENTEKRNGSVKNMGNLRRKEEKCIQKERKVKNKGL